PDNLAQQPFNGEADDLRMHLQDLGQQLQEPGLLKVQTASMWLEEASKRPIPQMLFSEFWLEGELCMLFADTNVGKSILAVQLGDSISRGVSIPGFKLEASPQKVLYVDFELSDKQFEARYSEKFKHHYSFNDGLLRAEFVIPPELEDAEGQLESMVHAALANSIVETGAKILIIDNITYLSQETERARHALPLMKHLKALQRKYDLSILTLAHTPKRDLTKPLTRNDLQGSKMLINFCDSAFTIGESTQDSRVRYLKQIKARSTEVRYHGDQVCVCELIKPSNFLHFKWLSYGAEIEHLKQLSESDKEQRIDHAIEMKVNGASNIAIAQAFGVGESTVRYWFSKKKKGLTEN
ncbi:MAG: AAA family ATPase, partial [Bacteroidota bacterium]